MGEPGCDLARFALKLLLFESVDEFDGGVEPYALAVVLDRLDADRGGEMRLARAGAADQDDVVGVFQELASVELTLLAKSKPARSRYVGKRAALS